MPAFEPPNPYGSYFNFNGPFAGDPTPNPWRNPNYPNIGQNTTTGVSAAAGAPQGGINPTQQEFFESRRRDIAYQQFIARSVQDDARTRTVGNMIMQGIYGNDVRARAGALARVGGADAYNGMIGTMMSLPGISGYMGGSARSLPVGALSVATSGLTMNGYGVFGDKGVSTRFADALMSQVNQRFYGANGNPILSMTNGLNRDQMGGLMMQAGAQGAFAGLDMGVMKKLDAAGNNVKFIANSGTLSKITEFIKDSTKALGSLIDVYGNISSGELLQKAQEITGLDLSRLGNAKIMSDRIEKLRDTARLTGVTAGSMFDLAARTGDYASSIGMNSGYGVGAAIQGAQTYAAYRGMTSGFFAPSKSAAEFAMMNTRDLGGMARDPIGSRLAALQLLIQQSPGITDADALRSQAAGMAISNTGVADLDHLIRNRFGVSASSTIRGMGGALNLQNSLSPESQEAFAGMANSQLGSRRSKLLEQKIVQLGGMNAGQASAMHLLASSFDPSTIEALIGGTYSGDAVNLVAGTDSGKAAQLMGAVATMQGMGPAGALHAARVRDAMMADTFLSQNRSAENMRRNSFRDISRGTLGDYRGNLLGGGFMAGMLDRFTGNDPISQLEWLATVNPGAVAGLRGTGFSLDTNKFRNADGSLNVGAWNTNLMNMSAGLNGTGSTAAMHALRSSLGIAGLGSNITPGRLLTLQNVFNKLSDPEQMQRMLSGFDVFGMANGNTTLADKSEMTRTSGIKDHASLLLSMANDAERAGHTTEGVGFRQLATALAYGGNLYRIKSDDVLDTTHVIARMSAEQMGDLDIAGKLRSQLLNGGSMSDATMRMLQNSDVGGPLAAMLQQDLRDNAADTSPGHDARRKRIEAAQQRLSSLGVTATGGASTQKIDGSMDLFFDNKKIGEAVLRQATLTAGSGK